MIDLLQVRADPQSEAIFGELAHSDAAPGDLAGMKFLDSIARERFPQAGRKVERVSSGIGHLDDTVAQRERHENFLESAGLAVPAALEMLDVAKKLMSVHR